MSDFATRHQVSSAQRGLSPALWNRCPRTAILNGHLDKGWGFIDDFVGGAVGPLITGLGGGGWTVDNATAGTAVLQDMRGGWLELDAGSSTADQGVQVQRLLDTAGGECFVPQTGAEIFFECRIYPDDLGGLTAGNGAQLFFGLGSRDATFMASGVVSATDYVGFKYDAGDTSATWHFAGYDGTEDDNDTGATLTDGSTVKLGFWISGTSKMVPYVNGKAYPAAKITAAASVPSALMAPTMCCLSEGTVDPLVHVDYVACFQVETLDSPTGLP